MSDDTKDIGLTFDNVETHDSIKIMEKLTKKKHLKLIKIKIIQHIPKIILLTLLILLILIYVSSNVNYGEQTTLILDKFCNLFMGMTIALTSVYLLCTRLEHVHLMDHYNNRIF